MGGPDDKSTGCYQIAHDPFLTNKVAIRLAMHAEGFELETSRVPSQGANHKTTYMVVVEVNRIFILFIPSPTCGPGHPEVACHPEVASGGKHVTRN